MTGKRRHGIVNGGHTFAASREAIETAEATPACAGWPIPVSLFGFA